jgi:hypothetical protein
MVATRNPRHSRDVGSEELMKTYFKRIIIALLFGMGAVGSLCSCCIARRQIVSGEWSEPAVQFSTVRHSSSPDGSVLLVFYYYQLKQSAHLKYPHYVWKNTDWERSITERLNVIDAGYGIASINGPNVTVLPVVDPVSTVLWSNGTALCKAARGWFSIIGNRSHTLPMAFASPEGVTNALSEPEPMLPTTADQYPQISQHIRDAALGATGRRNYYKQRKKE